MNKEKQIIEKMAKHCPFYEEGKCNLLEDEATECNFDCDMCDFATNLYNADYRKQEWISVDERLPEESCEVLTVDRTEVMCLAPYSDRYTAFNATDEDGGDRWKITVTHWMPLPEAPKMKGGEQE